MENKIFISHTRKDSDFCNRFDNIVSRVGLAAFRSEFENINKPEWATIKNEINQSRALFLLVGTELKKGMEGYFQNIDDKYGWKFTQNWISYEVGIACQKGIDVWVICDDLEINFPVPYLNNYQIYGIHPENKENREWYRSILENYKNGINFSIKNSSYVTQCGKCGAQYNLYSSLQSNGRIVCPTCLTYLVYPNGWLLSPA